MNNNQKISNKSILFIIISLAIVIIAGTFAWLSWRSQNTAMVLTIGDIRGLSVTLKPYQINATLSPVGDYDEGLAIDITADNRKTEADGFKLYYDIDTIDSALIDSGFKYTITKCTVNCGTLSNYSVLNNATGDFANASSNSNLEIYKETVPAGTTYKYKVYIWIDRSSGNQSNMQNKSFVGELRALAGEIYVYTVNTNGSVTIGQAIPNTITQYTTPEAAMAAFGNRPFFLRHRIQSDVVSESYVGFVVTSTMAGSNTGMTAGTYYLRGGIDESSLTTKPVYEANKAVLQSAFGASNCSEDSSIFSCLMSRLIANANASGGVLARVGWDAGCGVSYDGTSYCYG